MRYQMQHDELYILKTEGIFEPEPRPETDPQPAPEIDPEPEKPGHPGPTGMMNHPEE
jgi:hypothetical protein